MPVPTIHAFDSAPGIRTTKNKGRKERLTRVVGPLCITRFHSCMTENLHADFSIILTMMLHAYIHLRMTIRQSTLNTLASRSYLIMCYPSPGNIVQDLCRDSSSGRPVFLYSTRQQEVTDRRRIPHLKVVKQRRSDVHSTGFSYPVVHLNIDVGICIPSRSTFRLPTKRGTYDNLLPRHYLTHFPISPVNSRVTVPSRYQPTSTSQN